MPPRLLDEAGLAALPTALVEPVALARYRAKTTTVSGSEYLSWTGAVSGRSRRDRTSGRGQSWFWTRPRPVPNSRKIRRQWASRTRTKNAAALVLVATQPKGRRRVRRVTVR